MKEHVPDRQGIAFVALFILGNSIIYGLAWRAGRDLWLSFLVATGLSFPLILLYSRLHSLMHGQVFSEGMESLFGKWPSRIITLLYSGYAWRLGSYVVSDVTNFIQAVSLRDTPQFATALGFVLLVLWAVKEGAETLARWSSVMIVVVGFVLVFTLLLATGQVDLDEFLPVMYDGFGPVLLGALQIIDSPFLETILIVGSIGALSRQKASYTVFLTGFVLAAFFLMLVASFSLAVLGTEKYTTSYYPIFMATARIDVAEFLTRLELVVGVIFALGGFLKMAVCLLAACKGLAHTLGFSDYRFLATPLVLSVIPGARWLVKSSMEIERSATKVFGISDVLFQVVLPICLWIVAEIRISRHSED